MKKKLFKTIIQIEILSEYPIGNTNLREIICETEDGDWSGQMETIQQDIEISGKEAVKAVKKQGSDLDFFQMDEEGNEI